MKEPLSQNLPNTRGLGIALCLIFLIIMGTGIVSADSTLAPTISRINPLAGYNTTSVNITNLAGTNFWGSATTASLMPAGYPVQSSLAGSLVNGTGGARLDGAHSVFVKGTTAYVASINSDALEIVDVSNPASPVHLANLSNGAGGALLDGAWSVHVYGNYAYVASRDSDALEIVNIANPASPVHVIAIPNGTGTTNRYFLDNPSGIYVANGSSEMRTYAYVVSTGSNTLQILDVTNPGTPIWNSVFFNVTNAPGNLSAPRGIFVTGDYAYIASELSHGIEVVNIANRWSPSHAGFIGNGAGGALLLNPYDVKVAGNYAYVASWGSNALEIVNVTDPRNPRHESSVLLATHGPMSVAVSGIYAYVATQEGNSLEVIDISNPAAPVHKNTYTFGGGYGPNGVFVSGDYAYVANNWHRSLDVVAVTTGTIRASSLAVVSPTRITCWFPITNRPAGQYHVVVTSPDLQRAVLVNGFTIQRQPGPATEPAFGWKYRGELNSTGQYNDGGNRPPGTQLWNNSAITNVESTPAVVNGVVYFGGTDRYLYALHANNGSLKWRTLLSDNVYSSPAVHNGIVYIGVGSDDAVPGVFYALNAETGATVWSKNLPGGVKSSPAVYNGTVYVGRLDGNISAWNAATGADVWRFRTSGVVSSAPAVSNGRIIVETDDWNLFSLDATTGAKVWDGRNSSSGWDGSVVTMSDPAVAYGKVYLGGSYEVYAFDELTGARLYNYHINGVALYAAPAVADGIVYITTTGGSPDLSGGNAIYALDADDLTLRWANHTPANSVMLASPAVANGIVYVTSERFSNDRKGYLYAWDAATGTPIWNFDILGDGTHSSPAVANGVVYFGQWWHGFTAVGTYHPDTSQGPDTPGLYQQSTGTFLLKNSFTPGPADVTFQYGAGGSDWSPLIGDWDADGDDTVGLYQTSIGVYFVKNSNGPGNADTVFPYGAGGNDWIHLSGDWDGDGDDTVGAYQKSIGMFFLKNTNAPGPADLSFQYGAGGNDWSPLIGDWDADGDDTVGLYQTSIGVYFVKNSNGPGNADTAFPYGAGGDDWIHLSGDWDGDGHDTVGAYQKSIGMFFLKNTNAPGNADIMFQYGPGGNDLLPVVGRWV